MNTTPRPVEPLLQHYRDHGYLLLPEAIGGEALQALRATTDRIAAGAAGLANDNDMFDFEAGHTPDEPLVQRIKKPHRLDPVYVEIARHPAIFGLIQRICGEQLRLNHSKINMKAARAGAPLDWHQDWAFAPHTNMSTCVASVMIDDTSEENGAMQVLPASHLGPLHDHHDPELGFVGAIDAARSPLDTAAAVSLVGAAGTVSIHHPMMVHGSSANLSGRQRRILFLEYAASDAYPLFYDVDWEEYNARLLSGPPTSAVRCEPNVIKLPLPSRAGSSIYKAQAQARSRWFEPAGA